MVGRARNTLVSEAAIPKDPGGISEPVPEFDKVACYLFISWDDQEGKRKHSSILDKDK